MCFFFFFFNDTATTEIYTLPLHDALPIFRVPAAEPAADTNAVWLAEHYTKFEYRIPMRDGVRLFTRVYVPKDEAQRSEEHTSELQSLTNLVCRLLLEKKKEIFCKRAFHVK